MAIISKRGQHKGQFALAREVVKRNLRANAGFEITHKGEKFEFREKIFGCGQHNEKGSNRDTGAS